MNTNPAPATTDHAFELGARYQCRSIGDHNCVWTFEVVKRTASTVTLRNEAGELVRRKVRTVRTNRWDADAGEVVFYVVESLDPLGRYSMSPVLHADELAD